MAKQAAKFPAQNFKNVSEKELSKTKYDALILQAGSVDISNLNTRDKSTEHFDYFRQETVKSAENLFKMAESSLKNYPELKKVVIMKQVPRYDAEVLDPLQLKQALAEIYNNKLSDLWLHSAMKKNIFVGAHSSIACAGGIRKARYWCTQSGRFDGVHLYGPSGIGRAEKRRNGILKYADVDYYGNSCIKQGSIKKKRIFIILAGCFFVLKFCKTLYNSKKFSFHL